MGWCGGWYSNVVIRIRVLGIWRLVVYVGWELVSILTGWLLVCRLRSGLGWGWGRDSDWDMIGYMFMRCLVGSMLWGLVMAWGLRGWIPWNTWLVWLWTLGRGWTEMLLLTLLGEVFLS